MNNKQKVTHKCFWCGDRTVGFVTDKGNVLCFECFFGDEAETVASTLASASSLFNQVKEK